VAAKAHRTERRRDALSKERIVEAAIEILNTEGESAPTFRALTARLATGAEDAARSSVGSSDHALVDE
jgi:AcrR family transcriptional regulator